MKKLFCTSCGASDFKNINIGWKKPTLECAYCGTQFYDPDMSEFDRNFPDNASYIKYPEVRMSSGSACVRFESYSASRVFVPDNPRPKLTEMKTQKSPDDIFVEPLTKIEKEWDREQLFIKGLNL